MTAQEAAQAAVAVRKHLDTIRTRERRLWRSKRLLRFNVARGRHLLEVRDDAYRRLLDDNAQRGRRLKAAEELIATITAITAHPSSSGDADALELIAAHLGAYDRHLDELALYHGNHAE